MPLVRNNFNNIKQTCLSKTLTLGFFLTSKVLMEGYYVFYKIFLLGPFRLRVLFPGVIKYLCSAFALGINWKDYKSSS